MDNQEVGKMENPSQDLVNRITAGLARSHEAMGKGEEHLEIIDNTIGDICVLLNGVYTMKLEFIAEEDEKIQGQVKGLMESIGLPSEIIHPMNPGFAGPNLGEIDITSAVLYLDDVYAGVVGYLRTGDIGEELFNARHKIMIRAAQMLYGFHVVTVKFGVKCDIEKLLSQWREELEYYSRYDSPWEGPDTGGLNVPQSVRVEDELGYEL